MLKAEINKEKMEDKECLGKKKGLEKLERVIAPKPQGLIRFGSGAEGRTRVITGKATVITYTSAEKRTIQTLGDTKVLRSQT